MCVWFLTQAKPKSVNRKEGAHIAKFLLKESPQTTSCSPDACRHHIFVPRPARNILGFEWAAPVGRDIPGLHERLKIWLSVNGRNR